MIHVKEVTIRMADGDTDGIDSNGDITVRKRILLPIRLLAAPEGWEAEGKRR